jgi:hypothetical protein
VFTPDASDEQVAELHAQIEQIVQRFGGTLDKTDNWGGGSSPTRSGITARASTSSRRSAAPAS